MGAQLLDGKNIAEKLKESLRKEIGSLSASGAIRLAALAIEGDPSSEVYINAQKKIAGSLGIEYSVIKYPASASQEAVEKEIAALNNDDSVTGIIVQMPLPKNIKADRLFSKIRPEKDAEGLNPCNIGDLAYDRWSVAPCTANACMHILESTGVKLAGKEVTIVGHSAIVGKPLSLMLLSKLATTTVCHIGTYERGLLEEHVKRAEILVVAVGKSGLIKGGWIKKGAVVIDVGINAKDGKITGDVEFDEAFDRAAYITPVPGGVGPVTTVMLMKNLVELYKAQRKSK